MSEGLSASIPPQGDKFYPALDGLRTLAFAIVFVAHYFHLANGSIGVQIFFVLSGFLITGILYDTRNDRHNVRTFYVRRTLRIFPLYYGVMAVFALAYPFAQWKYISWRWIVWPLYLGNFAHFAHGYPTIDAVQRWADFQFVSGGARHMFFPLGHFWSLCVEEQFYLLWPFLVFMIRDRKTLLRICVAAIPVCFLLRTLGVIYLPANAVGSDVLIRCLPFCLDSLLTGGALALLLRGPGRDAIESRSRPWFFQGFLVLLLVAGAAALLLHVVHVKHMVHNVILPTSINLGTAWTITYLLKPGTVVYSFFNLRFMRWFGKITYGAYVLHDIPHAFYDAIGSVVWPAHPWLVSVSCAAVGTTLLAWASFLFFESPFLSLKKRLAPRPGAVDDPPPYLQEQRAEP